MKRLIVCCDGTWQSENNDCPTNVFKIAQAIKPNGHDDSGNLVPQVLYYDEGIGAVPSENTNKLFAQNLKEFIEKVGGGAFGWWIDEKIKEAYIFLCLNYTPGDEIYLFGFSRGAYTVRSLAGLIGYAGILQRPHIGETAKAYQIYRIGDKEKRLKAAEDFRQKNVDTIQQVKIKLLGCWDTVGALGIPDLSSWIPISNFVNEDYEFHDTELSGIIQNARHAIAIDEKRKAYDITPMKRGTSFEGTLEQTLFPGDHGCVGGGVEDTLGLSNAALRWMAEEATSLGLELDLHLVKDTYDSQGNYQSDHTTAFPSGSSLKLFRQDRDLSAFNIDDLHLSTKKRWCDLENYRPDNLKAMEQDLKKECSRLNSQQ